MGFDRRAAASFLDEGVARAYRHRPPYAPAAIDHVCSLAPRRGRALDLGCGPGKLAHLLIGAFEAVDAVDPSAAMLAVAQETSSEVQWIHATGEEAPLTGPYDLVTAGESIHWMEASRMFPRLVDLMAPDAMLACFDGSSAHEPPWQDAWMDVIKRWLAARGTPFDPHYMTHVYAFRDWMDVVGQASFTHEHEQPVEEFLEKEFSRATWSRAKLGADAARFAEDLHNVVAPYAVEGRLRYPVETSVLWGRPRRDAHGRGSTSSVGAGGS